MRPRGIPAENSRSRSGLPWGRVRFNEAAGNTRGKRRRPRRPSASRAGFNEAAGNTRGKLSRENFHDYLDNYRFNEAAGNTRGKLPSLMMVTVPRLCFNEAAGNTRGKLDYIFPGDICQCALQ